MKLDSTFAEQAAGQLAADSIPEDHLIMPQLTKVFGDETFFVNSNGLYIIEAGEPNEWGDPTGKVVRIACWSDTHRTVLAAQPREPTGAIVIFKDPDSAGAADHRI